MQVSLRVYGLCKLTLYVFIFIFIYLTDRSWQIATITLFKTMAIGAYRIDITAMPVIGVQGEADRLVGLAVCKQNLDDNSC